MEHIKKKPGVEEITRYNQNGNKLDSLFIERQEEPTYSLFDKNRNKFNC